MQKDFHYCMIKVLAEKAGFKPDEAQIIAYASQYVDDAVEHMEIKIRDVPQLNYSRLKPNDYFDPICTAHKGLQYVAGITRDAQRKVYVSFHFIPSEEYGGTGRYDYCTIPDSNLAREILRQAIAELKAASRNMRIQKLIKLGIALHSFADTWAHQRFSGRLSAADNDVERIHLFGNDNWESLSHLDQLKANLFPEVGHIEAMNYPDFSHQRWRYEHDYSGIEYKRDNTAIFFEAAKSIFELLCEAIGQPKDWDSYADRIKECLSLNTDSIKRKFENYRRLFREIEFDYHEEDWRNQALTGNSLSWIDFQETDYAQVGYTFNGDLKWFYFHMEAYNQRMYVMERIKQDLI
ncbi:MAG: hypothetical protein HY754_14885 [Nitrospirae bacterium]|nr:hypothetical protein [Nitrospirota bacterium]